MGTILTATGITFPDATIQTSSCLSSAPIAVNPAAPITLRPGEFATYSFATTAISTHPLNINTAADQMYDITIATNQALDANWMTGYMYPNNVQVANAFTFGNVNAYIGALGFNNTSATFGTAIYSGFTLPVITGRGLRRHLVSTSTAFKCVLEEGGSWVNNANQEYVSSGLSFWNDAVTVWTSLGTLQFLVIISNVTVIVRRIS